MMKALFLLLLFLIPVAAKSQIIRDTLYSKVVSINKLGDYPNPEVFIYVPREYEANPDKSYPVVYILHAFGTTPDSWLGQDGYENMNISNVLDSLIESQVISPMIAVMPNTHTWLGGTWFTNSLSAGNWMDFVAEDLTKFIDDNYRTIRNRNARGITGQSLGAYGALLVGMSRPEVFGAIHSMSPPNISSANPFGDQAFEAALQVKEFNPEAWNIFSKLMWSKAVSFSPVPESPPFYAELPVQKTQADEFVSNEQIWKKWNSYLLTNYTKGFIESLKQQELRLEIGNKDPLFNEVKAYSSILKNNDVEHKLIVFEGDHVNGVRHQFENSVFHFFNNYFRQSAR